MQKPNIPTRKSKKEMELYIKYGKKFNKILLYLRDTVHEGLSWDLEHKFKAFTQNILSHDEEIESITYPFIKQKNYMGTEFLHAICVSVGELVAHGKPTVLKVGDIVSVDCGICLSFKNGYVLNFDAAFTTIFGLNLDCTLYYKNNWIWSAQHALERIEAQQPKDTREISVIIRKIAKINNLKQVVSLRGHGIGRCLHEPPAIHNAPGEFKEEKLFNGLVFCAEPIYIKSDSLDDESFIVQTVLGSDGWEVFIPSGEKSSHFETMFGVINGQIIDLIGISKWKF